MDNRMIQLVNEYLGNERDTGSKGRATEVITRAVLNATAERVHPLGVGDVTKRYKGSLEVKTGSGWLVNPCYASKDEALQEIANGLPNFKKSRYIAYAPAAFLNVGMTAQAAIQAVTASVRVYKHREFLECVSEAGLFVAKKSSSGVWGVAIQTFTNSMKREALWYSILENHGTSLLEFAEKWKG